MSLSFAPAVALGIFAAVIVAIASNRMHMTVAASLGAVVLLMTGVLSAQQTSETINSGEDTIALFFGGMVMARTLIPTGIFDNVGSFALRLALESTIAKAICLCAIPNDGHSNAIARVTNTKDGWIAVLGGELRAGAVAKADGVAPWAVVASAVVALADGSVH